MRTLAALALLLSAAAPADGCFSRRCRMPRWRPCGPCVLVRWGPCSAAPVFSLPPCESRLPGTPELLHMPEEDSGPAVGWLTAGLGGDVGTVPNLLAVLPPPGVQALFPLFPGDLTPGPPGLPPGGGGLPPDVTPPAAVPAPSSLGLALLALACLLTARGRRRG